MSNHRCMLFLYHQTAIYTCFVLNLQLCSNKERKLYGESVKFNIQIDNSIGVFNRSIRLYLSLRHSAISCQMNSVLFHRNTIPELKTVSSQLVVHLYTAQKGFFNGFMGSLVQVLHYQIFHHLATWPRFSDRIG